MAGKDKATGGSGARVEISAESLQDLGTQITELDTKIASASGSDTAAKKAWVEQLISQNADTVNPMVDSLMEQLAQQDLVVLVGLIQRIDERVKADLVPKVDEYVNTEFPKTQTTSKEEVEGLRTARKELLTQFKALREVLNTFKIPNEHVPDPRRSGGGRPAGSGGSGGKSGANKEGYRYLIDGKPRPKSQNSFSSVAFYATDGCPAKTVLAGGGTEEDAKKAPKRWGADELKAFIVEKTGAEFGAADTFDVELPNGKKVSARRLTDQDKVELGIVEDANDTGETQAGEEPTSQEMAAAV